MRTAGRLLLAVGWTAVSVMLVLTSLALSQLGDCTEDVITGTHTGPCVDHKYVVGWTIIVAGFAIVLLGNGLILRKRKTR